MISKYLLCVFSPHVAVFLAIFPASPSGSGGDSLGLGAGLRVSGQGHASIAAGY